MTSFTESHAEDAALAWLDALGYSVLHGPTSPPSRPRPSGATLNSREPAGRRRSQGARFRLGYASIVREKSRRTLRSAAVTIGAAP